MFLCDFVQFVFLAKGDFENDQLKLLRGVVRAEKVEQPSQYIDGIKK